MYKPTYISNADISTVLKLDGSTGTYSDSNGLYQPDGEHDGEVRWKHKEEDYWILRESGATYVGNKRNYGDAGFVEVYSKSGTNPIGDYDNEDGEGDVSVVAITEIVSKPCVLHSVVLGETSTGTIEIKNGDDEIGTLKEDVAEGRYVFDAECRKNLSITTSQTPKLTVLWKPIS